MAGDQRHQAFDRLGATFGVHAVVLPLLAGERLQQRQVCFAQQAEYFERLARVAFFILAGFGPGLLIIRGDGRAGRTQDLPQAEAGDDLAISEVRHDFRDRPFVWRWTLAQLRLRGAFQQAL